MIFRGDFNFQSDVLEFFSLSLQHKPVPFLENSCLGKLVNSSLENVVAAQWWNTYLMIKSTRVRIPLPDAMIFILSL